MPSPLRPSCFLAALLVAACSHGGSDAPITTRPPTFVGSVTLAQNSNSWVPQAAVVSLATDVPTRVELRITDPERSWQVVADKTYATQHDRVPVVGMRADRVHTIEVLVRDQNGNVATAPNPFQFTTPPLPSYFPPIDVRSSLPQYMEAGVTLLSLLTDQPGCMPTLVDAAGNVVWYLDCALTPIRQEQTLALPLDNGNIMLIAAEQLMVEVNLLGDIVQMFFAAGLGGSVPGAVPVDTESFHHDVVALPPGSDADFAVLGTELRVLPDYPSDVVDPTQTVPTANVIGDEIVEFTKTGAVVRRIRLLDILDPYRVTYDSLNNFWDQHYGNVPTCDWSHANALVLDPRTNSWIVSLRHQDIVFQVQRSTGQLEWILGDHDRWTPPWSAQLLDPVGNLEWQYHQHAPQLLPDGTIYLFDNGCGRAVPPTPQLPFPDAYSRAVRFQVDPVARTAEQLWAYGGPPNTSQPSFYSFFVSSAYHLPQTGNVLVCDGGKLGAGGRLYGHVFEITTEATPQTVFECYVQGDGVSNTASYFVYRAYRLPGVYR